MFEIVSFVAASGIVAGILTEIVIPLATQGAELVKSVL
jgi:hypothetical protein